MKKFKDKNIDQQYKIIREYIKKIETICITTRDKEFSKLNNEEIIEIQSLPLFVDFVINLIYSSKLSDNFKELLIKDINLKLEINKKIKTR